MQKTDKIYQIKLTRKVAKWQMKVDEQLNSML